MLIRPAHRGAYEQLWSEQRYVLQAVSLKMARAGAGKLGRVPQLLALLAQFARGVREPRTEERNALLTVYDHLRPHLSRERREQVVESILRGGNDAFSDLYKLILEFQVSPLYGCRLFFPPDPVNLFWDFGDLPGLWIFLGPHLVHLSGSEARRRTAHWAGLGEEETLVWLDRLRHGWPAIGREGPPPALLQSLDRHAALVRAGNWLWLHPRAFPPDLAGGTPGGGESPAGRPPAGALDGTHDGCVSGSVTKALPARRDASRWEEPAPSPAEAGGLLTLEIAWSNDPETIGDLPPFYVWESACLPQHFTWLPEPLTFDLRQAYAFLAEAFVAQQEQESGRLKTRSQEEAESPSPSEAEEDGQEDDPDGFPEGLAE